MNCYDLNEQNELFYFKNGGLNKILNNSMSTIPVRFANKKVESMTFAPQTPQPHVNSYNSQFKEMRMNMTYQVSQI